MEGECRSLRLEEVHALKICFVCLGNICRSPIAEVLFRKAAVARGHGDWIIESRGTNRYHKGGPADERAIAVCAGRGVDLADHIATRFRAEDFRKYDLVLTMAADVVEEMRAFSRETGDFARVQNFLDVLAEHRGEEVPDPWYGGTKDFEECFDLIERAASAWVARLEVPVVANRED